MPYVDKETKARLDNQPRPKTEGELTYLLTRCLIKYLEENGVSYARLADCLGALAGAESDLNRRMIFPYEARKQAENGDVWPEKLLSHTMPARVQNLR